MAGRAIARRTVGATGFGKGSVEEATKLSHKQPFKSSNLFFLSPSASSTTVFASSSSSSSSSPPPPFSAAPNPSSCFCDNCDGSRFVCVADRGKRERKVQGICSKCVFGSVPSKFEVDDALSSLLQAVAHTTEDGSDPSSGDAVTEQIAATASADKLSSDGRAIEPAVLRLHNQSALQSYGSKKVSDAFHLLQIEPSIKRMVVSLSTDKTVWNAILNNEVVQEVIEKSCREESAESLEKGPGEATSISECIFQLGDRVPRTNLFRAERGNAESSRDNAWSRIAKWILNSMKVLVVELTEKIIKHLIDGSKPSEGGKSISPAVDHLGDALTSSLVLTVLILLIVIVSRANGM